MPMGLGLGLGLGRGGAGGSAALAALAGADGLAMFASDDSMAINHAATPANNFQGTPGAQLTTARATAAMYWDADGLLKSAATGTLRRDFDPRLSSTTERCGYLIEEARTNLALQTNAYTNAAWTATNLTMTEDQVDGPLGAATMALGTESSATATLRCTNAITVVSSSVYTISAFLKRGNSDWVRLIAGDSTGFTNACRGWFNLATGAAGTTNTAGSGWSISGSTITAVGGGVYRCTITITAGGTSLYIGAMTAGGDNNTNRADVGSGNGVGSTYYVDCHQVELGSFASSYIPTAGSTVTRAADLVTLAGTLFPLNQSEGTLYAKWMCMGLSSANQYALGLNDGTLNEFMGILRNSSLKANSLLTAGGSNQLGPGGVGLVSTANVSNLSQSKSAFGYKLNDCAVAQAGESVQNDTSCIMPSTTTLVLGNFLSGTPRPLNGWLFEAMYAPTRLTDVQLAALAA